MTNEEDIPANSTNDTADTTPWYAVRLFVLKQKKVDIYLKDKGLTTFIPMEYSDFEDQDHHVRHVLHPVVHNLIFLKKTLDDKQLRLLLQDMPYKVSIIRKSRESTEFYPIPAKQMIEFQAMCNPEISLKKYLGENDAKLKKGTPVYVKYGPLKGLTGKLVRSDKKYYLLKEVPGLAVMLKVSRWCCRPLEA